MSESISIIDVFKSAVQKKELKKPYLIAYAIGAFYMFMMFLSYYLSYELLGLSLQDFLQLSYAQLVQHTSPLITLVNSVQIIYGLVLFPIIEIGAAWLGLRSAKSYDNKPRDCFKLMHFYLEIIGFTFIFRILSLGFLHIVLHKTSLASDFIMSFLLAPLYIFTLLHLTNNAKMIDSFKFALKVCFRYFPTVFVFYVLIFLINVLGLITLLGWIWLAPISSRAWGLMYISLEAKH